MLLRLTYLNCAMMSLLLADHAHKAGKTGDAMVWLAAAVGWGVGLVIDWKKKIK